MLQPFAWLLGKPPNSTPVPLPTAANASVDSNENDQWLGHATVAWWSAFFNGQPWHVFPVFCKWGRCGNCNQNVTGISRSESETKEGMIFKTHHLQGFFQFLSFHLFAPLMEHGKNCWNHQECHGQRQAHKVALTILLFIWSQQVESEVQWPMIRWPKGLGAPDHHGWQYPRGVVTKAPAADLPWPSAPLKVTSGQKKRESRTIILDNVWKMETPPSAEVVALQSLSMQKFVTVPTNFLGTDHRPRKECSLHKHPGFMRSLDQLEFAKATAASM